LEQHFRFSRRNLALIFTFGFLVPYAVYKGCVAEAVSALSPPFSFVSVPGFSRSPCTSRALALVKSPSFVALVLAAFSICGSDEKLG
jgi:hypothetical protein